MPKLWRAFARTTRASTRASTRARHRAVGRMGSASLQLPYVPHSTRARSCHNAATPRAATHDQPYPSMRAAGLNATLTLMYRGRARMADEALRDNA